MIVIELSYKGTVEESIALADKHMAGHLAFLKKYYEQGVFIASGPKKPREGGVIIAAVDKATAAELIQDDPFYQHDICNYRLIEFASVMCCEALSGFIEPR